MKNEHIFDLMGAIPPDLIEEADIQAPARRRLPRLARTGLIAACLCLALIGTAAAVHYSNVRIVDGDDGFIEMRGSIALHPYDSFSDEIKAIADEHTILPFSSWQKAEDFIGVDLMNNPVLDAASTYSVPFTEGDKTVRGPCLVFTSPGLYFIRTECYYRVEYGTVRVMSQYYTQNEIWIDRDDWDDWDDKFFYGVCFPDDDAELTTETYTAPSGLTAQILVKDQYDFYAAFTLNGNPTIVQTAGTYARDILTEVLDGFILD